MFTAGRFKEKESCLKFNVNLNNLKKKLWYKVYNSFHQVTPGIYTQGYSQGQGNLLT